jgi:ABC-type uncharacterized transport system substrate-binding protein
MLLSRKRKRALVERSVRYHLARDERGLRCSRRLATIRPRDRFNRKLLAEFAAKMPLLAMFGTKLYLQAAGPMSYGADYGVPYRRAATSVDMKLKGAKPADLPVEHPAQSESMINMKTAKVTGVSIQRDLPLHADRVIE